MQSIPLFQNLIKKSDICKNKVIQLRKEFIIARIYLKGQGLSADAVDLIDNLFSAELFFNQIQ